MYSKKKAGVAILISDKVDFKATKIKRDTEGHYIMVKGSIQQEELMNLNIYGPNTGAPRYIRQVLNGLQRFKIFQWPTPNPQNIHSSQHHITPSLKLTT